MKQEPLPPCAADALWRVRRVTVGGYPVGISNLDEGIAGAMALGLRTDHEIRMELVKRVRVCNKIPAQVEEEYARVLLEEYRKVSRKRETMDKNEAPGENV